jgi:putative membrane protein
MNLIANLLTALVALCHLGFLVLEMFFWDHPLGRRVFEMNSEFAAQSASLATNQGLYNGFLAAGLRWGLWKGRRDLKIFFLCCVVIAGLFGGITARTSILFVQALPGLIALVCVLIATRGGNSQSLSTGD